MAQCHAEGARRRPGTLHRRLPAPGASLTNLYNAPPTWLELAHRKPDEAVLDAYGWPHDLDDEEILRRLLELNLEQASE